MNHHPPQKKKKHLASSVDGDVGDAVSHPTSTSSPQGCLTQAALGSSGGQCMRCDPGAVEELPALLPHTVAAAYARPADVPEWGW